MNSYLAKIIFNINIDNGKQIAQFDEQLRLINAVNADEALLKARSIGRQQEETFVNAENKTVRWNFIDVTELLPLNNLKDGDEVYSNTHEVSEANAYINFIKHKAMIIQCENLMFL